ncbi:toxin Bro [Butyricicoccus sp. AM28-25]|nr:Bro-N domain-containing protein [Butyricicoccus sp. AM28-25]RHT67877.1 toxin Bro [Butyricicoccus sp. AM28-25]
MKNNIVAFKYNEQQVRTIEKNGEPWFVGKDVAEILGYSDTAQAVRKHIDNEDKGVVEMTTPGGKQPVTIINESGLYSLILSSKLPTAKEFKHWVTSEVLPSIHKTGEYKITPAQQNRLDIMERNSRAREASLWLRISAQVKSDTYRQVCASYASTVLAGREVIPLPQTTQHHYSATEIGAMFGVSKQAIGNLANTYGMKTDEYGAWYHDKSPYSAKEVDVFKYNDHAVQRFRDLLA